MQRPAARFISALAMVMAAALGAVSCGSPNRAGLAAQGQPQSPGSSPRPGSSSPASSPAPTGPSGSASPPASHRGGPHGRTVAKRHRGPCAGLSWQKVTASKPRVMPVPPVPLATSVRLGTHPSCRYDRLVIHFTGRVPGYEVRYVSAKAAGPEKRDIVVAAVAGEGAGGLYIAQDEGLFAKAGLHVTIQTVTSSSTVICPG